MLEALEQLPSRDQHVHHARQLRSRFYAQVVEHLPLVVVLGRLVLNDDDVVDDDIGHDRDVLPELRPLHYLVSHLPRYIALQLCLKLSPHLKYHQLSL